MKKGLVLRGKTTSSRIGRSGVITKESSEEGMG
jgi:hypothetical protein